MSVASGILTPFAKLIEVDVTPAGRSYTVQVDGIRPRVAELLAFYSIGARSASYRSYGAMGQIVAVYTGPEPGVTEIPIDKISLKTSQITQELYANARYSLLPPAVMKQIRQTVQDGTDYSDATGKITAACVTAGISNGLALELYDWIVGGTDTFRVCARTITRTRTVSPRFDRTVSQADVEKLFTPAQLAGYLGTAIPFTVPDLGLTAAEANKGLVVAWQKTMCDCDDTAGGQSTLTEAWELAKWVSLHYQAA